MNHDYPDVLIIPLADILEEFFRVLGPAKSFFDNPYNTQELLTQIFQRLLNDSENIYPDDEGDFVYEVNGVPDFNRMLKDHTLDPHLLSIVMTRSADLLMTIRQRIVDMGGIVHGAFPYVFRTFMGSDVVLDHIPY